MDGDVTVLFNWTQIIKKNVSPEFKFKEKSLIKTSTNHVTNIPLDWVE